MKNKFFLVTVLIFMLVVIAVVKFDKFSFAVSSGKVKVAVSGDQRKAQDDHSQPSILSPVVAPSNQTIDLNKTQGDQSPIVNNSNSTSTITYGAK
ncbi:MAG: hypothetical protein M0Q44_04325 [Methylobacter sp.]|jgi:hypothetical protein|nr:hypothetical protein [Methylobacter sp.]